MRDSTGLLSKYTPGPVARADAPLLILGVSDVVILEGRSSVAAEPERVSAAGKWVRDVLVPDGTAQRIKRLAEDFNIVWASEWGPNAHVALRDVLGLPATPWPYLPVQFNKLEAIQAYAAGRSWVWIDEPTVDLEPVPSHAGGVVVRVDPSKGIAGIEEETFQAIRGLAREAPEAG